MTDPNTAPVEQVELLPVVQRDREAATRHLRCIGNTYIAQWIEGNGPSPPWGSDPDPDRYSLVQAFARHRLATTTPLQARVEELESEKEKAVDDAATFCIEHLSKMLGSPDYVASDGSEEWEGDVAGTMNNVLVAARVLDPWDWSVARHAKFHEEDGAALNPGLAAPAAKAHKDA